MAPERGSVRWHRGGWEIRLQVDGRRHTRRVPGPNTRAGRRAAEDALDALARTLATGTDTLTVAGALDRHLVAKGATWSPSTLAARRHHAAHIITALGDVPVTDLRREHVEATYATWTAVGAAAGTVRRRHGILAAALHHLEGTVIARSPTNDIELPTGRHDLALVDLPAHHDIEAALDRLDHERLAAVARLALATGARRGELAALRWSDIDGHTVRIRAAIASDRETLTRKATKGRRARVVTVDDDALEALAAWRATAAAQALTLGTGLSDSDPIFASPSDPRRPWHPDRITKTWDRHRDAVGLPGLRFHDLRHRHATTLLEDGIPVHVVSARLGHSSAKMTWDVYAHALPAGDREAAASIARARRGGQRAQQSP